VLAFLSEGDYNVPRIREITGSSTVDIDCFIGRSYLKLHWTEYSLRFNVLNACLSLGINFRTPGWLSVHFDSTVDSHFTQAALERKLISLFKSTVNLNMSVSTSEYEKFYDIWNWQTAEGKAFCQLICETHRVPFKSHDHKENYFNWPLFKDCDFDTLMNVVPVEHVAAPIPSQSSTVQQAVSLSVDVIVKNTDECVVCLDGVPDTMVLPCECVSVCKKCSDQLKFTPNKFTCMKCQKMITHVLD
jgi:hypothetical protein